MSVGVCGFKPNPVRASALVIADKAVPARTIGGTTRHERANAEPTGADVSNFPGATRPAIHRFAFPGTASRFTNHNGQRSARAACAHGAATNPPIATTAGSSPRARAARTSARALRIVGPHPRKNRTSVRGRSPSGFAATAKKATPACDKIRASIPRSEHKNFASTAPRPAAGANRPSASAIAKPG
jgi:hypothetical protein